MDCRIIIVCLFCTAYAQYGTGEKPGRCPSLLTRSNCFCRPGRHGCHSDYECPGDLKCCDRGCSVCGPICMSPEDDSHGPGNICFLPKNPQGSRVCYGYFPRWWYNWHTNECERFIYGGCNGNANNFETRQECERRCKHRYLPGGR
uniref:Uncharacterized protein n=1 Tax=Magallana gigas TaxID=29159 RepID=A0A8W8NJX7_MAGGI|nr:eppin-like [Crassostrea gigas]